MYPSARRVGPGVPVSACNGRIPRVHRTTDYTFKDRVGRSGCDLPWGHLNDDIYLDIKDKDTYYTPQNSLYSYPSGDMRHHCHNYLLNQLLLVGIGREKLDLQIFIYIF